MEEKIWDLIIVGAGPSALTAAIYTSREDISTLILEKGVIGGLMATIDKMENYPGFPNGVEGLNLAMDFQVQAERFGAKIDFAEVQNIAKNNNGIFEISTDGDKYFAKTVLIATGNDYRKIGISGEENAHYCATCDGAYYKGKKLAVIGGANTAVQEAIYLTKFATHVDLVVRSYIKATEILKKELQSYIADGKITLHEGVTPDEIIAENGKVIELIAHKTDDPEDKKVFAIDGVFVFAGTVPNSKFLTNSEVKLDEAGHILTDENLMTDVAGLFASGDVHSGAEKQVTVATGEGTTAALNIREYLHDLDRK